MSKLKDLKLKYYLKIKQKYPDAEYVYRIYKTNNLDFHINNKLKSLKFFSRLISANKRKKDVTKIPFPRNTYNPFLTHTCGKNYKLSTTEECKALPDTKLLSRKEPVELVKELSKYDIISFDVFDTLIFRPFSKPTDVYTVLELKNKIMNFSKLRIKAEEMARKNTCKPNYEIDIYDIYEEVSKRCCLRKDAYKQELELEKQVCYANPYMLEVFNLLKKKKKKIIIISDMYLPSGFIKELLEKNGYSGFDKVYVSCEYGYGKASGKLFEIAEQDYSKYKKFVHIGDSEDADIKGAQKAGVEAYHYEQCNKFGNPRRPYAVLSPVSAMYNGVVNNYLHNGTNNDSARECFGFLYGGPIVAGYCEWINEFTKNNNLEKICFIARDMDIFYKTYNKHYRMFDNEYVSTSRISLQECLWADFTDEVIRNTIAPRTDKGYTIAQVFAELNISFLLRYCVDYKLNEKTFLLNSNLETLSDLIREHKEEIAEHFKENEEAAKQYFKEKIDKAKRVCFADLGWQGSIIGYLRFLLVEKWNLCDEVKGVLFGTTKGDVSINLISRGDMSAYAYSHIKNRDLVKQDWNLEFLQILILESLFTSTENSLIEYNWNSKTKKTEFLTAGNNPNKKTISEFHTGMMRFIDEFEKHRSKLRDVLPMSAVDAFEPLNLILNFKEYIALVIGDMLDTPNQLAGIGIKIEKYVPLGEIMLEKGVISKWPL